MAHTHTSNLIHCVFSTKDQRNPIPEPTRLWEYVGGIARGKNILLLAGRRNCKSSSSADRIAANVDAVQDWQELKGNASRWLNDVKPGFAWQQGYSAFSVSQSHRQVMIDYIDRQPEHHAQM